VFKVVEKWWTGTGKYVLPVTGILAGIDSNLNATAKGWLIVNSQLVTGCEHDFPSMYILVSTISISRRLELWLSGRVEDQNPYLHQTVSIMAKDKKFM
jgi:hypothetical protein